MGRFAAIAMIALATAGCIGSGSSADTSPSRGIVRRLPLK
jgi:hypothetical protein